MITNNLNKLADIIVKADKFESSKRFSNEDVFKQTIKQLSQIESKLVKLNVTKSSLKLKDNNQFWSFSFQIIFKLDDPYVDTQAYNSGSVFIFPSNKLYKDIDELVSKFFECYPQWDDSKTIATVTGNAKV